MASEDHGGEAVAGAAASRLPAEKMRGIGGSSLSALPTPCRGGRRPVDRPKPRSSNFLEDLMRQRGVDEAWGALEGMLSEGRPADKFTVSRMLMKTVGEGGAGLDAPRAYRGVALVERFVQLQPNDIDEVLLNALLDICRRLRDLPRLEKNVETMRKLSITPSTVTLGILVKAYGQAGNFQQVMKFWDELKTQRLEATAVTFGCMLDACVKCRSYSKALEIFVDLRKEGRHKNTILYTTMIKGCGLERDLSAAMRLFLEMQDEGVPYNTITYNSMLEVCVKCGDLAAAEEILHKMCAPGNSSQPDLITFSTMLKGYCHAGDMDRALQAAETIKCRGLRCDELVYNTLIDGCVKAGDFSAGIGLFEEMMSTHMKPSAVTHNILLRLYRESGFDNEWAAVEGLYSYHRIARPGDARGQASSRAGRAGRRSKRTQRGAGRRRGVSGSAAAASASGDLRPEDAAPPPIAAPDAMASGLIAPRVSSVQLCWGSAAPPAVRQQPGADLQTQGREVFGYGAPTPCCIGPNMPHPAGVCCTAPVSFADPDAAGFVARGAAPKVPYSCAFVAQPWPWPQ